MSRPRPPAKLLRETILALVGRDPARPVDPTEVARTLAGRDEKVWRLLMPAIRTEAQRLAKAGEITMLRKGRRIDPADVRGLYRLAATGFVGRKDDPDAGDAIGDALPDDEDG